MVLFRQKWSSSSGRPEIEKFDNICSVKLSMSLLMFLSVHVAPCFWLIVFLIDFEDILSLLMMFAIMFSWSIFPMPLTLLFYFSFSLLCFSMVCHYCVYYRLSLLFFPCCLLLSVSAIVIRNINTGHFSLKPRQKVIVLHKFDQVQIQLKYCALHGEGSSKKPKETR